MAKSLVTELRGKGQARLSALNKQIGPLVKERDELAEFLGVSVEEPKASPSPAPSRRAGKQRAKRSRKGGRSEDRFVEIVGKNPGITVAAVAKKLGLKQPNYLYRVAKAAESGKRVVKEGKGYKVPA